MRIVLAITIFVISLLASASTAPVSSQETGEAKTSLSTGRDIDYEFRIGERIRSSMLENCSIVIGIVRGVRDQGLELAVEEQLSGDGGGTFALNPPDNVSKFSSNPAWENATAKPGSRLLVSRCGGSNEEGRFRTVVSDERYFSSVRDVIAFEVLLRQNSNVISDLPRMLAGRGDSIFAGYATQVLNGSLDDSAEVAVALSRILEDRLVPPVGLAFARIKLRQLMIKEGERAMPPDVRRQVLTLIVSAGSKDEPTEQVFVLLNELAERNKLNIKELVTASNRHSLRANYQAFLKNNREFKPQPSLQRQLFGN